MSKKKHSKKKDEEIKEPIENTDDKVGESEGQTDEELNKAPQSDKEEKSIKELEKKIKELQDTVLRKAAEFENYKRRTENDQLNLIKYAAESFILKILPIYDDLQRSVDHLDESNMDSLKEGLKLVLDKFSKTLDEQGVKKLESKGKEFDVEYHEALMQQPSNKVPANTVLEEVEAGYQYKDKVIRHAKVIVSQGTNESEEEESNESNNESEE